MRKRLNVFRVLFFELCLLPMFFLMLLILDAISKWVPFVDAMVYYGVAPAMFLLCVVPCIALGTFMRLKEGKGVFEKTVTVFGITVYRKKFFVKHVGGECYSPRWHESSTTRLYRLNAVGESGETVCVVGGLECLMFSIGDCRL